MKPIRIFLVMGLFLSCFAKDGYAQQPVNKDQLLDRKQQGIVSISAFTANGDSVQLQKALKNGLDAGLTVNEIKEVIIQLYAYTGFPRSLNALNSFMDVLKERKQKGIKDELGKEPNPLPANKTKLLLGTEIQTKLVGRPVKGELYEFAPAIDQFLKEHLFGAIFGRDNLDFKTREIATISALASLGGIGNQLRAHFGVGLYNGLTEGQLNQLVSIIQSNVGAKEGIAAGQVLQSVLKPSQEQKTTEKSTAEKTKNELFPKGEIAPQEYFTGTAWVKRLVQQDETGTYSIGNVVFEPGARTHWHMHPAGQTLLVLDGKGWYQEKGKPARSISKGDVVVIPSNTVHWHGAAKDSSLIHLAITNSKDGGVKWLQPVTGEEYNSIQ